MSTGLQSLWRRIDTTPLGDLLRGEVTSRLDPEVAIGPFGLPPDLVRLVGEVARRARLWRGERLDVARELASHFRDGLDSGRSPEALASEFGDPAQAARLIRRARRRARPWWWHVQRRVTLALAAIGLVGGLVFLRFWTLEPLIKRNYRAELTKQVETIPPAQRAWPLYRAALIDFAPHKKGYLDALPKDPFRMEMDFLPGDPEWEPLAAWLRGIAPILDQIRTAAALPHLGYAPPTEPDAELDRALERVWRERSRELVAGQAPENLPLLAALIDERPSHLSFVWYLILDARLAMSEGDGARAIANLHAMLDMTEQIREYSSVLSEATASGGMVRTAHTLQKLLADWPDVASESDLLGLSQRFAAFGGPGRLRLDKALAAEQAAFEDFLQRIYSDDGNGDGRLTRTGLQLIKEYQKLLSPLSAFAGLAADSRTGTLELTALKGRRANSQAYADALAQALAWQALPAWERRGPPPDRTILEQHEKDRTLGYYAPLAIMLPNFGRWIWMMDRSSLERDLATVVIALEIHRRRHGQYPASLSELAPELISRIPLDPFDGQPLRYRINAGQPLIYSIGADRVDDGGLLNLATSDLQLAAEWRSPEEPIPAGGRGDWILFPLPERPGPLPEPAAD